jgi:hypothetical protein
MGIGLFDKSGISFFFSPDIVSCVLFDSKVSIFYKWNREAPMYHPDTPPPPPFPQVNIPPIITPHSQMNE